MLIKSPRKKQKVRPNKRKKTKSNSKNGAAEGFGTSKGASHGKRTKKRTNKRISLPRVKPWKVILGAMIVGALGILYLNHVFATQKLLQEVQQAERKYNQAKRKNDDYRLTYDRMIGPADIYRKAKKMGFINGGPAEKVIEVKK